jgi:surface polysaccharide O-acyltransferase-like enzyme
MNAWGINLWAVLTAAISTMVVGFLWYSPILFAKPWTVLMGYDPADKAKMDEMRKGAGKMYALAFIASLLAAAVLEKIIRISTVTSPLYGIKIGLAVWLGFVTTVQLTDGIFSKKPPKLYLINTCYQLVCFVVMGAILAVWPR